MSKKSEDIKRPKRPFASIPDDEILALGGLARLIMEQELERRRERVRKVAPWIVTDIGWYRKL